MSEHKVFSVTEHKVLDTLDDVVALVLHLQIEIDIGHTQFLAVHSGNEVLDVLVVRVSTAQHHYASGLFATIEDEGVGLAPFGLVGLIGTRLVKLERVGGEASEVGHRHILFDVELREVGADDLVELSHPFLISSFVNILSRGTLSGLCALPGVGRGWTLITIVMSPFILAVTLLFHLFLDGIGCCIESDAEK